MKLTIDLEIADDLLDDPRGGIDAAVDRIAVEFRTGLLMAAMKLQSIAKGSNRLPGEWVREFPKEAASILVGRASKLCDIRYRFGEGGAS